MKVLATIAGRGGSKGVKDKNIRELAGKPLIAYTIEQVIKWGKFDKLIVSTDSEKIAAVARQYGAAVPFMRPAELAGDTVGKLDVLRHALKTMEAEAGEKFDLLMDFDITAPIRKISDIEGVYQLYQQKKPKTVFTVVSCRRNPYFNVVEIDPAGYAVLAKKIPDAVKRRQDAPQVYDLNASIYAYDREYLLDGESVTPISDRSLVWVMEELSAFDIDSELDLKFVEYLVKEKLVDLDGK